MSTRRLSRLFTAAAFKRLNACDVKIHSQNKHTLSDAQPLVALFGSYARSTIPANICWFSDEGDTLCSEAALQWSKQRRVDDAPSRLSFREGEVTDSMDVGSGIVLAVRRNGPAVLAVVRPDSTIENQICWLFGMMNALRTDSYVTSRFPANYDTPLDFPANHILQKLFINPDPPSMLKPIQLSPPPG